MKQIIEKLTSLERDIASEKGEFSLFALFLREDADDTWDLLGISTVARSRQTRKLGLSRSTSCVRGSIHKNCCPSPRIVLLEKGNPILEAIHKAIKVRHGMAEVGDSISFGVPIKHAYIITSARENSPKSGTPQPA